MAHQLKNLIQKNAVPIVPQTAMNVSVAFAGGEKDHRAVQRTSHIRGRRMGDRPIIMK
jgi:hypothetical protein